MKAHTIDFLLSSIMLIEDTVLNISLCMDNLFHISNYLSCVSDFSYVRRCFGLVIVFSSFLYPLFCCLCLTSICVAYAHMGDVFHISDETFLYKNEVGELGMNLFFYYICRK